MREREACVSRAAKEFFTALDVVNAVGWIPNYWATSVVPCSDGRCGPIFADAWRAHLHNWA